MVEVFYRRSRIIAHESQTLRQIIHQSGFSVHNGQSRWLNCKGLGSCGTCAIRVEGPVTPLTTMEKWRLNFPPHKGEANLRLACQCRPLGEVSVVKETGFWGHKGPASISVEPMQPDE
ncbi:MAG: 2Fe-2S iron-sulfur cluster-binding protein [Myxococcota bacterium]